MVDDEVALPFHRIELTAAQEFAKHAVATAMGAALNTFGANLWGLGITIELETATVDAYLFFASAPSDLDRYEISEFLFAFDCDVDGPVAMRVHRTVMDRGDYLPTFGALRWIHLERHPSAELPDDVGFDELDY